MVGAVKKLANSMRSASVRMALTQGRSRIRQYQPGLVAYSLWRLDHPPICNCSAKHGSERIGPLFQMVNEAAIHEYSLVD